MFSLVTNEEKLHIYIECILCVSAWNASVTIGSCPNSPSPTSAILYDRNCYDCNCFPTVIVLMSHASCYVCFTQRPSWWGEGLPPHARAPCTTTDLQDTTSLLHRGRWDHLCRWWAHLLRWELLQHIIKSFCEIWWPVFHSFRDHFVYTPSQWGTTLHCNVLSHWLGAYIKWSLQLVAKYTLFHCIFCGRYKQS